MANFGDSLKRQRELREISLREISDATKINIRYLEALEQNRFDVLPGGLFNKGFIRAYATYIGVDCEETVNSYLEELATRATGTVEGLAPAPPGLHRPASAPRRRSDGKDSGGNGRPIAITIGSGPAAPPAAALRADAARAVPASPNAPMPRPEPPAATGRPIPVVADPAPAVSHIEASSPIASPSRALSIVLMVAGGIGAAFLILSLVLKHPAPDRSARRLPEANGAAGPSSGGPAEVTSSNLLIGSQGEPPEHRSAAPAVSGAAGAAAPPASTAASAGAAPGAARTVPPHALEPPPAALPTETPTAPPAVAAPMDLQVETTAKSWVQLFCDGREAINWVMKGGESESMRCQRTIQVSAADAGAVLLRVNGAPCAALGEAGTRVHAYTIRSDDFTEICPAAGRGHDGLR